MDSQLVMSVLNDALEKHPHPEIFNTATKLSTGYPYCGLVLDAITIIEYANKSCFVHTSMECCPWLNGVYLVIEF
jgi:uncharacterized protein (DUF1501 family)